MPGVRSCCDTYSNEAHARDCDDTVLRSKMEPRLFLIELASCGCSRPRAFAVECKVDVTAERYEITRIADSRHELSTDEWRDLLKNHALDEAILSAERARRGAQASKG